MNPLLQAAIQLVLDQLHYRVETVSIANSRAPTVFFHCLDSDKRQESVSTDRLTEGLEDPEDPERLATIAANIDRWLSDHGAAPATGMIAGDYTTQSQPVPYADRWEAQVDTKPDNS